MSIYPPLRRLYSSGYQQLTRLLFRLPTRDTQTGIKLIRRETLAAVLPKMAEKRFAFDLELLVVARRTGYRNFVELPVQIAERFTTTISPKAVWRTLLDTFAIFYRLRVAHFYGPQLAPASGHSQVSRPTSGSWSRADARVRSLPEHWRALGLGGQAAADPCLQLAGSRASPGRWRRGLPAVGGARVGEVRPRGDHLLCRRGRQARAGACRRSGDHTARRTPRRLPGGQALLATRGRRSVRSRGRLREHEAVPLSSLCGERTDRGRRPPGRQGDLAVRDSLADLRSWPLPAGAGLAAGIPGCTGRHGVRVKP